MRKFIALCAVLALGVFVLNGFVTLASNQDSFWNEAAQGGLAEISLSSLALQKSQNDEVKQMAQKIIDDHTAANNELTALAASKSVTLPTSTNAKQKAAYEKLSGLSGDQFDAEFVKMMIKDHESSVKLFQKQSTGGTDADVKAFAAKTLPTLQAHLDMARSMNDKMKGMKSSKKNSDGSMNSNSNDSSNMSSNSNSDSSMNSNSNSNSKSSKKSNKNSNSNMNVNSNSNKSSNSNTNSNSNSNDNRQ